jgi:O-antigen/teichoic acid export membrane protein
VNGRLVRTEASRDGGIVAEDERVPYSRDESEADRLDRNYSELLQELRVAQMGIQILFAFLLGIAFQQRFAKISDFQRDVYLTTLLCAAVSAALFIAPVAMHRAMFRRHLKDELVVLTGRLAVGGLLFLGVSMLGALLLIIDVVIGTAAAWTITAVTALVFGYLWYVLPMRWRRRRVEDGDGERQVH